MTGFCEWCECSGCLEAVCVRKRTLMFIAAARGVKALVQHGSAKGKHRNLALVLGRVAQWVMLLFGLLIAVTVAFPSFTPANQISALGITGIAIGFAFKDIFDVIHGTAGVATDPAPDVLVTGYADNGLALRMRWWINPPRRAEALDASDVILAGVKNALTKAGIDLPFPTQQFLFHDQTEATDGDRRSQRKGWPSGDREVPAPRPVAAAIMAQPRPAAEAGQQG